MRAVTKTFCEILGIAVIVLLAWPIRAAAQRLKPIPPLGTARAQAQTPPNVASADPPWTPLTNQPTFLVNGASSPLLLTDGTVMVQDAGSPDWWRLTPGRYWLTNSTGALFLWNSYHNMWRCR